jgi:hypothetical protein
VSAKTTTATDYSTGAGCQCMVCGNAIELGAEVVGPNAAGRWKHATTCWTYSGRFSGVANSEDIDEGDDSAPTAQVCERVGAGVGYPRYRQ